MAIQKISPFDNANKYAGHTWAGAGGRGGATLAWTDGTGSQIFNDTYTPEFFSFMELESEFDSPDNMYKHRNLFIEKTFPKGIGAPEISFRYYKTYTKVDTTALDLKELEEPTPKSIEKASFKLSQNVAGNLFSITDMAVIKDMDSILPHIQKTLVKNRLATEDYIHRKTIAGAINVPSGGFFMDVGGKFKATKPATATFKHKDTNIFENVLKIVQKLNADNLHRYSNGGYRLVMSERAKTWFMYRGEVQRNWITSSGRTLEDVLREQLNSFGLKLDVVFIDDRIAMTCPGAKGNAAPTKADIEYDQELVNADANDFDLVYIIANKILYRSETLDSQTYFGSFIYKWFSDAPNSYLNRFATSGFKILIGSQAINYGGNKKGLYGFLVPNIRSDLI